MMKTTKTTKTTKTPRNTKTRTRTTRARTSARTASRAAASPPRGRGLGATIPISPGGEPILEATPAPRAPAVRSTREALDEAFATFRGGLLEGDDDRVLAGLGRLDAFAHVYFGVDRSRPLVTRPQNARLVPEAGRAIVRTARAFELEGRLMRADPDALEGDIEQLARLGRLQGRYEMALAPVVANVASFEVDINDEVRRAHGRIESAALDDAALRLSLEPARQLIKGPAQQGVARRGKNARLVQEATDRALRDSRREAPPQATQPPSASVVIPVTPGVQPGAPLSAPAAPTAARRSRRR